MEKTNCLKREPIDRGPTAAPIFRRSARGGPYGSDTAEAVAAEYQQRACSSTSRLLKNGLFVIKTGIACLWPQRQRPA